MAAEHCGLSQSEMRDTFTTLLQNQTLPLPEWRMENPLQLELDL